MATYRETRGDMTAIYGSTCQWRDAASLIWTVSVVEGPTEVLDSSRAVQDLLEDPIPTRACWDNSRGAAEWLLERGCPRDQCGLLVQRAASEATKGCLDRLEEPVVQRAATDQTAPSSELVVVFRLGGAICRSITVPYGDHPCYGIATRDARGGWDWTGTAVERTSAGQIVSSPARALAHATKKAARKGWSIVPWSEIGTLNLQGATVSVTALAVDEGGSL